MVFIIISFICYNYQTYDIAKSEEMIELKMIDLTGKTFGEFKVIKISEKVSKSNNLIWNCKCSCGNIRDVIGTDLTRGKSKSCGCLRQSKGKDLQELLNEEYKVDGVYITDLKRKIYSNNKTGVKGVSIMNKKNGIAYRAIISVGNKKIHLGYFDDLEDAKQARLEAEMKYHQPYINKHEESTKGTLAEHMRTSLD